MSRQLRDQARDAFCQVLLDVGPDAHTLCEGWDAHQLTVHVWGLTHDPLSWPGVALPAFAGFTEARYHRVRQRLPFVAVVLQVRRLDGFAAMPTDRFEGYRHALGEFVVHTEDVRRANGLPTPEPSPELAEGLWCRARTAARQLYGRRRRGLRLVATDPVADPEAVIVGGPGRTVTGPALEVLLWVHGRRDHARVEVG